MPNVREIMTPDVYTTTAGTTLSDVAQGMVKGRIGSAIVMEAGWLGGIFTERDALRAIAAGADATKATVDEWMTKDPITVGPDADAEEAAQLMASNGFRHLPVVDGSQVLGIVSLRDVLGARIKRA